MNREYTFFSWSVQSATNPIPMVRAEGIYFWDATGKRYIDFSSQLMNMNIGRSASESIQAIHEQASQLCYAHPGLATEPRGLLGRKSPKKHREPKENFLLASGELRLMKMRSRLHACTPEDLSWCRAIAHTWSHIGERLLWREITGGWPVEPKR